MQWWNWVLAAVAAVSVVLLLLLWFDTRRERNGGSVRDAARAPAIAALAVPAVVALVLISPWWLATALAAIPLLALAAMAMAS